MKVTTQFKKLEKVSDSMYLLQLMRPKELEFIAGQYMNVTIETSDGEKLPRSYSISSHPSSDYLEAILKFPENSRAFAYFDSLNEGDEVLVKAPYGRYVYQDNELEKIHVVTGSGLGPSISMLKEWALQGARQSSALFLGIQKLSNVPMLEELKQLAADSGLKLYICTSREDGDGNITYSGRVLPVLIEHVEDFSNKEFYICGIPQMVKETIDFLHAKGVAEGNIHHEKFEAAFK